MVLSMMTREQQQQLIAQHWLPSGLLLPALLHHALCIMWQ
jgi:hypothetical protein